MYKKMKVSQKFGIILVPMMAMLFILLFLYAYGTTNIEKMTTKQLYSELYTSTDAMINADRDLYQAYSAELEYVYHYDSLTDEERAGLISGYQENVQQTKDRIKQAVENIMQNDTLYAQMKDETLGMTIEELYADFQDKMQAWESSYDMESGSGDYAVKKAAFEAARDPIDLMSQIIEAYAVQNLKDMHDGIRNVMISVVAVVILIITVLSILSAFIIKYLTKSITKVTDNMNQLSNNDLSFEPYEIANTDELGVLSHSVKKLTSSLSDMTLLMKKNSDRII